jgi:hypothetical protein
VAFAEAHLGVVRPNKAFMGVDASPLTRLEHKQVHAKGAHPQLTPQRLETLTADAVQGGEGDVWVGRGVGRGIGHGVRIRLE